MKVCLCLVVACTLLLSACHSPTPQGKADAAASPTAKTYKLDLALTKSGPRRVRVEVATDLPEGTNLHVNVGRSYWKREKESEEYSGEIFSKDVPIANGTVAVEVDIIDSIWLKARQAKKEQFTKLGIWTEIGKVSPEVEARVLYSSMRDQPESVQRILGKKGEHIVISSQQRDRSMTTLEARKALVIPFRP